ncbi:C45 family autoproteolytic acyltransferase/hydolase [Virgifigura deserti]|uniref:C45 family autoproteolytic acyltransferase/hydolase n=1 Tax=Virgifigura deserti TaxID=2268457 RepID=UPI003CCC3D14
MTEPSPFPLVVVSGEPFERGRQYGAAASDRIARSVDLYSGQLEDLGCGWAEVRRLVDGFVPTMESYAPDLVEEMRGIAEGAGCEFAAVALVNARTEVLQLARRKIGLPDDDADGCTGAVILPKASADGVIIHGQNWDWRAECADTGIVLQIRREDGPDLLTFTEAGGLARNGFNAAGVAITANYLESDRDYRALGIPLPLIRRRALESQHFAHAIRAVATTPKSGSNNMMLSHVDGFAIDLECAPDEAFALYPEQDLLVHANHWVSPVALAKLKEVGISSTPDSYYRDVRVREALAARHGKLGREDLKAALSDDFGTPYAVCRPPQPNARGNLSATVAMVIMQPSAGIMEIAPLPALNRSFTTYKLEMTPRCRDAA